jgi:alkylation response protein AidB-like acyl-CoA dehydrogenase
MSVAFTPEQKKMRESVISFARKELNPGTKERDTTGEFSFELWKKCADYRLLALPFPEEYGGDGFDFETTVAVYQALGYASKDSGLVHAMITQVLCGLQILHFGSESQKCNLIPDLVEGRQIYAQAITEPESGSNALQSKTLATKMDDGRYELSGSKTMISNGPVANQFIVFAVTDPKRAAFGGITSFILPASTNGLSTGKPLDKLGLRTLKNSEVFLDKCLVQEDTILGRVGQGAIIFNESMEFERTLLPACLLGDLQRVVEGCVSYARERKSFGQSIGKYQAVSHKIAAMKMNLELGFLTLLNSAQLKTAGKRAPLETSITKLYISESYKKACIDAIQIHGGYGYTKEFDIERELRNSFASTIYSGTSEMQANIIARILGL